MPTDAQLRTVSYPDALLARAAASKASTNLPALDAWYRDELRSTLATRQTNGSGGYLTVEELGKLMEWKLARGKWRPRLVALALSNSPKSVQTAFETAFPPSSPFSPPDALKALSTLSGIGPATASAILALFDPSNEPFLSDEAYEGVGLGKAEYTVKAWVRFREKIRERKGEGRWESVEELEKALWAWAVLERTKGGDGKEKIKSKVVKRKAEGEEIAEKPASRSRKKANVE